MTLGLEPGRVRVVPYKYHIHLALIDGTFWRDHLAFRDWLRQHPTAAAVADILRTAASNQQ